MRNIEHERGAFAHERISRIRNESWAGDYKSYVKRAPAMILTNGLAQALSFYYSKSKGLKGTKDTERAYTRLFEDIDTWMIERGYYTKNDRRNCQENTAPNVLEWLVHCASDIEVYRATMEVLALLNWMKRFADAMIEKQETGE